MGFNYCPNCGFRLGSLPSEYKSFHLLVILDESGSMYSNRSATVESFDSFMNEQKEKNELATYLTLTKFNTCFYKVHSHLPIIEFVSLDKSGYNPSGGTALNDAIVSTITNTIPKENERTLCLIITDGEENSSQKHSLEDVKKLVSLKREQGWEFVFMGANIDSYAVGASYNIGTTVNYTNNPVGVRSGMLGLSNYAISYSNSGIIEDSDSLQETIDNLYTEFDKTT